MRLSNELSIRPATRSIVTLPYKPSRELRGLDARVLWRALNRRMPLDTRTRSAARRLYLAHLRRLVLILVTALVAAATIKPALATITVSEARYAAGVLVVRGETSTPLQEIGLDDRYFTRADKHGRFLFPVQYLPHDCTITLAGKDDHHIAFVEGCLL